MQRVAGSPCDENEASLPTISDLNRRTILLDVPVELLLAFLRRLPQSDILTIVLVSKYLHANGTQFLNNFTANNHPELARTCELFRARMLTDTGHLQWLYSMKVDFSFYGRPEDFHKLVDVLRLARNLTSLSIHGPTSVWHPDLPEIVRSLSRLRHLDFSCYQLRMKEQIRLILSLPSQLQELEYDTFARGPLLAYVPLLSHLRNLHTLHISWMGLPDDNAQLHGTLPQLPSVRNLRMGSFPFKRFPALFLFFPHLENLELGSDDDDMTTGVPPYPASIRLARLTLVDPDWPLRTPSPSEEHVWQGLEVGWIRLPASKRNIGYRERPDSLFQIDTMERWLRDGFPLGMSLWARALGRDFWARLAATVPAVRWVELDWAPGPKSQAVYDTAGLLGLAEGTFPLQIVYLNLGIFSALSYSEDRCAFRETGALPEELEGEDEHLCARIVDALPRYIPSLRYLTVSRIFDAVPYNDFGPMARRTWRCYKVTGSRDVVEIPTWEGDRVEAYCRGTVDVGTFDDFDARFTPLR